MQHSFVRLARRIRSRLGLLGLVSLIAVGPAAATPIPVVPTYESIVAQFADVAFGHEHGASAGVVQKWSKGPDLAFYTAPNYDIHRYLAVIGDHVQSIRALTGMRFTAAEVPAGATLRLGFYPRADFAKMPGRKDDPGYQSWVKTSACIALSIRDRQKRGNIEAGAIAIGIDIPERQRQHCILEELVQVLGLPNDACHYRPSLFCEKDHVFTLTPADRILLRTLYDRRLPAGTPREEAMPIVRQIIAELVPKMLAR